METLFAHARSTDPETSHEAAESIPSKAITQQKQRILSLLAVRGALTDQEIADSYSPLWPAPTDQSLRSRRSELVTDGFVEFSGDYGLTSHNGKSRKWQITAKGRRAL